MANKLCRSTVSLSPDTKNWPKTFKHKKIIFDNDFVDSNVVLIVMNTLTGQELCRVRKIIHTVNGGFSTYTV